ncbi:MAG: PAS domain S-box protein [Methanoregula sp.]|nr:PAS domain S-box protein [Methanoregula sp.]
MISVLYVDDEPALLELGKVFLEQTDDFVVDTLDSAKDVPQKLTTNHYDAIISDYQMPGMDGIDLLKIVRRDFGSIPFILFTGKGREDVVIEALDNGVDFYLQKGGSVEAQYAELAHKVRQAVLRKTAEQNLKESEKRLFDIINFLPDPTFAIDKNRHVIAWNRAMENLTGVPAAEMIGSDAYSVPLYGTRCTMLVDLVFEQDCRIVQGYSSIIREKDSITGETELSCPNNKPVSAASKASPLYDNEGKIAGAIESIRDITPRKEAEKKLQAAYEDITKVEDELRAQYTRLAEQENDLKETEENYRILMEHSLDSIYLVRGDRYLLVNSMTEKLSGYTHDELMARSLWDCVHPDDRDRIRGLIAALTFENSITYTARIVTKSGDVNLFEFLTGRIMYKGAPAVLGIARDITNRETVSQQLAQKTKTLSIVNQIIRTANQKKTATELLEGILPSVLSIIDYSSGGIYLIGADNRAQIICTKDLGEDFIRDADNLSIHIPPYETVFVRGEPIIANHYETLNPARAKKYGLTSLASIPIIAENEILGAINVASRKYHEILPENIEILTAIGKELGGALKRMQTRDALKKSEKNFWTFVDNAPDAILISSDNRWVYANEIAISLFGAGTKERLVGRYTFELVHPSFYETVKKHLKDLENHRMIQQVEELFLKADGTPIDVEISAMPVSFEGKPGTLFIARDISERKRTTASLQAAYDRLAAAKEELREQYENITNSEQELRESESLFRSQFDYGINGIAITQPDTKILTFNRQFSDMMGYSEKEFPALNWPDSTQPDEYDIMERNYNRLLEGKLDFYDMVVRIRRKDRSWISCRMIVTCHRNPDRTVRFVIASFEDITVKLQAERALRESEEKYRQLFELDSDALFVTEDVTGKILDVNEAAIAMYGYSRDELLAMTTTDLSAEPEKTEDLRATENENHVTIPVRYHRKKDGTVFPVEIAARFLSLKGHNVNIGSIRDISDQVQVYTAVKNANEKLNLLSSVTRHDIVNQLTILRGCVRIAQKTETNPALENTLKKIEKSARIISREIEFTKTYQNLGIDAPGWYQLGEIIEKVTPPDIPVTCSCRDCRVFADPMIEKVFANLIDNALRHGEFVTAVDIRCKYENDGCKIIIQDNGIGIPQEEKEQIFLKGYGKNTGFGLFLAREILALTNITICETGVPGSGARFEIRIPVGSFCRSGPANP